MLAQKQNPGTGPARKRKQMEHSHCSFGTNDTKGVPLQLYMDADESGPRKQNVSVLNSVPFHQDHAHLMSGGKSVSSSTSMFSAESGDRMSSDFGKPKQKANDHKGNTKTQKRKQPVGRNQHNKTSSAGSTDNITAGINEYRRTQWYTKAVQQGFKNQEALDRFNQAVTAMADMIDPRFAPVCEWCGRSDITLCNCLLTNAANAVQVDVADDVLVFPRGEANFQWRFMWVDRIRRMFVRPSYNPEHNINHNIGWMSPQDLDEDTMLLANMLSYIRLNQHSTYIVNNVEDRRAKLAHSKKLALRYLDELKVPLAERCQPSAVARIHYTVQKATDQPDDRFLFSVVNEEHNITSFVKAPGSVISWQRAIIIAAIVSPALVKWGALANMRLNLYIWSRLTILNARILVSGSFLMSKSLILTLYRALRAIAADTLSGPVRLCCTAIQQWLCNIVRTMSMTLSSIDISRRLLSLVQYIGTWCTV